MRRDTAVLTVAGGTLVTALLGPLGVPSAVRLPVTVAFVLVVPGLGWSRRLGLRDGGDTAVLAVALSICAAVLISETMALLHLWSPEAAFLVLEALALAGVLLPERWSRSVPPLPQSPGGPGPDRS